MNGQKTIEATDMGHRPEASALQVKDLAETSAGAVRPGHYGPNGKITAEGMRHVIRAGGSVLVHTPNGAKFLNKLEDIPKALALIGGEDDRQAALDEIARQRRELDAQEQQLAGAKRK